MAWPTVPVVTTSMDQDTDPIARSDILDLTTKFNSLIAMLGVANGVCDLDAGALVPDARIPAAIARLASPAFTGTPTAPTPATADNSTAVSTTAMVRAAISAFAPAEIAASLVAANGYIEFSNGLIFQWVGGSLDQNSLTTIALPLPWPTGMYGGLAMKQGVFISGLTDAALLVQATTATPLTTIDVSQGSNGGGLSHALALIVFAIGH